MIQSILIYFISHNEGQKDQTLSTHKAIPIPPPTHRAATPLFLPVRFKACNRVTRILAPEAPIGCPRAIAPPDTLTWQCKEEISYHVLTTRYHLIL